MKVEISNGELVDKVTILQIKSEKIFDPNKLRNIRHEFILLYNSMLSLGIDENSEEFIKLKEVNLKLWEIEEQIREKEQKSEFGNEFIALARSVYINNDIRAQIKRKINETTHSELIEEKEYAKYKSHGSDNA